MLKTGLLLGQRLVGLSSDFGHCCSHFYLEPESNPDFSGAARRFESSPNPSQAPGSVETPRTKSTVQTRPEQQIRQHWRGFWSRWCEKQECRFEFKERKTYQPKIKLDLSLFWRLVLVWLSEMGNRGQAKCIWHIIRVSNMWPRRSKTTHWKGPICSQGGFCKVRKDTM